ncbi:MAG: hypothetical protein ACRC5A_13845 [Enterobacteriaceae bacterium]
MSLTESYTPDFIAQYRNEAQSCQCEYCQNGGDALVTHSWRNQIRDSGDISCQTLCQRMLFDAQAFILHEEQRANSSEQSMDSVIQHLNQLGLNLAVLSSLSIDEQLYGLGILLSRAEQQGTDDLSGVNALSEQLAQMAESGELQRQFSQLPEIDKYQLAVLKKLGAILLMLYADPMQAMNMLMKMNELVMMSDAELEEQLQALRNQWSTEGATWFNDHPRVMQNYLIYRLYHDLFPAADGHSLSQAYWLLVCDFFNVRMLLALWLQSGEMLDEEIVSAIFSAYHTWRKEPQNSQQMLDVLDDDPQTDLLMGLSLLLGQ